MKLSKKDQIIETATQLMFDKGIAATSMDDIAAAVPVSKMTIYKYFSSKDQLAWEVLDRYVRQSHADMTSTIQRCSSTVEALLTIMESKDAAVPEQFLKDCYIHHPEFIQRMMSYYTTHIAGEFERLILDGQQKGEIRKEISPHVIVLYLRALKEFFSRPDVVIGMSDFQAVGEQFRSMFLYGIVSPDAPKRAPAET